MLWDWVQTIFFPSLQIKDASPFFPNCLVLFDIYCHEMQFISCGSSVGWMPSMEWTEVLNLHCNNAPKFT